MPRSKMIFVSNPAVVPRGSGKPAGQLVKANSEKLAKFHAAAGKRPKAVEKAQALEPVIKRKVVVSRPAAAAAAAAPKKKKSKYVEEEKVDAARQAKAAKYAAQVSESEDEQEEGDEEQEDEEEFLPSDEEDAMEEEEEEDEDEDAAIQAPSDSDSDSEPPQLTVSKKLKIRKPERTAASAGGSSEPKKRKVTRATRARRAMRHLDHVRNTLGYEVPVADINSNKARVFVEALLFQRGDVDPEHMPSVSDKFAMGVLQQAFTEFRDIVLPAARDAQLARLPTSKSDFELQELQTRSTLRSSAIILAAEQYMRHTDPIGVDSVHELALLRAQIDSDPVRVAQLSKETDARKESARRAVVEAKLKPLLANEANLSAEEQQTLTIYLVDRTGWQLVALKKAQAVSKKAQVNSLASVKRITEEEIPSLEAAILDLRGEEANGKSAAHLTGVAAVQEAVVDDLKLKLVEQRAAHEALKETSRTHDDEVVRLDAKINAKKLRAAIHLIVKDKEAISKLVDVLHVRAKRRLAIADEKVLSIAAKRAALVQEQAKDVKRAATIKARQTQIAQAKATLAAHASSAMDETE